MGRQRPQDADEANQQQRGLKQADREAGRELGELAGIFFDTLVGIDAELAGEPEPVGAARHQPAVEQMVRQPFAQPHLEHLLHPGLADHHRQQHADDAEEDQQLVAEIAELALLQRVEERTVPLVEPDLAEHIGDQHRGDADREQDDAQAMARLPERAQQRQAFAGGALQFVGCGGRLERDAAPAASSVDLALTLRRARLDSVLGCVLALCHVAFVSWPPVASTVAAITGARYVSYH